MKNRDRKPGVLTYQLLLDNDWRLLLRTLTPGHILVTNPFTSWCWLETIEPSGHSDNPARWSWGQRRNKMELKLPQKYFRKGFTRSWDLHYQNCWKSSKTQIIKVVIVKTHNIHGLALCHLQITFTHTQFQIIQVSLVRERRSPYRYFCNILEPSYFKLNLSVERKSVFYIPEKVTTVSAMYYQNAFYYMCNLLYS